MAVHGCLLENRGGRGSQPPPVHGPCHGGFCRYRMRACYNFFGKRTLIDRPECDGSGLPAIGFVNDVGVRENRRVGNLIASDAEPGLISSSWVPPSYDLLVCQI